MNALDNSSPDDNFDWDQENVVERIWNELDGRVDRSTINHVISDVVLSFEGARIKTFIPILVYKHAVEMLRLELKNGKTQEAIPVHLETAASTTLDHNAVDVLTQ